MNGDFFDFNRAEPLRVIDPADWERRLEVLRATLRDRAADLVREIFPRARAFGSEARIGDVGGAAGESLAIHIAGERAGLWHDHATGQGGDLIDLWRETQGYGQNEFHRAVEDLETYLGLSRRQPWRSPVQAVSEARKKAAASEPKPDTTLGPPTASWHYLAADGSLLGIVRRYDLHGQFDERGKQKKTFRPTNSRGEAKMPDPRPLYRIPQIKNASQVVLVEGEKCADALERVGVEATTAMGGAKTDFSKTDWSPLAGKTVVVWEDNDASGAGLAERVRPHLEAIGCTVCALQIPPGKPATWDAADAVAEGEDVASMVAAAVSKAEAPRPRFRFLSLGELASLQPPEWRIDGILPVHGSSVIYGAYESFKTFVALDMLLSLAAGRTWMGRATKPCGVVYIAGEGQYGLAPRVTGWLAAHGVGQGIPFLVLPEALALPKEADVDQLCEALEGLPWRPGVIALDTITRMSGGGSLNDEKDVQAYVRGMDRLRLRSGAHIMNVGHSGKNRDNGLFGSIVLPGAVETIICVERKGMNLTLINEGPKGKQKDGPNFKDIQLAAREVEFQQAGSAARTLILQEDAEVVAEDQAEERQAKRLGPLQQKIVDALGKAAREGQPLGFLRLKAMAGVENNGTLSSALRKLSDKGIIQDVGEEGFQQWMLL